MKLRLLNSNLTAADIEGVANVLNSIQLFFFATAQTQSVPLTTGSVIPLSPQEVEGSTASLQTPEFDLDVLLTHRSIAPLARSGIGCAGAVFTVSDHLAQHQNRSPTLWFVRRVLNIAMSQLRDPGCGAAGCICSLGGTCLSLCQACEKHFREVGYRDAIRSLKDALNWLNQRIDEDNPSLNPPFSTQAGRLRLAEKYVAEYNKRNAKPLAGKTIYMVLHFLSDVVPFVESLHAFGAIFRDMLLIAKPYPYARRDEVGHTLEMLGVRVLRASPIRTVSQIARSVVEQAVRSATIPEQLLIIEDGGYFAPIIHENDFQQMAQRCIGIVEQTTKGIREDRDKIQNPTCPILSVAECEFKGEYESPEIGRITVQNISRFVPNVKLSGRHAVVFGFGSVGEHVAAHLNKSFNMGVSVVDPDPRKLLKARHRKDIVIEAKPAFAAVSSGREALALVVGTTGRKSITKEILLSVPTGTIVVSTSSDRVEIEMEWLEKLPPAQIREIEEGKTEYTLSAEANASTITVLAQGYPINFYGSQSLPNDTIDPIMTLLLLCGLEIAENSDLKPGFHLSTVNELVGKRQLIEHFLEMT